jgi:hypothetical protein
MAVVVSRDGDYNSNVSLTVICAEMGAVEVS